MIVCPQCANHNQTPARFCGHCGASLAGVPDEKEVDPWIGRVVDKRYRVLSLIGTGGMGLVYQVEHIQLGKIAAMKVLHPDTARDADAVRRFRTEARAVSRLSHPNIVQTFDFGQADGALYLVMEYVRGHDLATLVKDEGPLLFGRAATLFVQICSALTDAHEAGVIHRDLKPENIVVVSRRAGIEHAKVLDFGLAKLRERTDGAEITSRGQVIGTPYYMSPEQVRGEPLDLRTDIYSLGASFYRVLTGTPPFEAPTPVGVLTMHITDPLQPPRERAPELNLPAAADAIVARAMAKAREDRYSSAAEVQHDLEVAIAELRESPVGGRSKRPSVPENATAPKVAGGAALPSEARERHSAHAATVALHPETGVDDRSRAGRVVAADMANQWDDTAAIESDGDADAPADSASESGQRLRKQDFEAFEQSLRRKKIVASLTVPALLLVAMGVGVWTFGHSREKASSVEREPNNTAAEATLLPLDLPVQGAIGSRQSGGQPDMDYFRVPVGKGARVVSARVEGVPGVDLVLELFDAQGTSLDKSDAHGAGGGEWLQPVTIGPSEAYLLVRQVWVEGMDVLEDVPDRYRLTVHWGHPEPGWEVEPNDWQDHATAVEVGRPVKGYLGNVDDKDWFAFAPAEPGYLVGRLTTPAGIEAALTLGDSGATGRETPIKPDKTGDLKIPVKTGERILLGIARRLPAGIDPKAEALEGLDAPYELNLDLRRAP